MRMCGSARVRDARHAHAQFGSSYRERQQVELVCGTPLLCPGVRHFLNKRVPVLYRYKAKAFKIHLKEKKNMRETYS